MKNRKNNKGFSLVELIVVVAIMAVLVGVLAPAYLKYVENSREKKDLNNLEEVRHAVEVALADEEVYAEVANGETVTIAATSNAEGSGAIASAGNTKLLAAVKAITGDSVELVSKAYNRQQTITFVVDGTNVSVVAGTVTNGTASGWAGAPAEENN